MRIVNLILTATVFTMLGSFSSVALAADKSPIKMTSTAQVEVEVTNDKGEKSLKRTPATKVVPGTVVVYTTTFENEMKKTAENVVINNPIPNNTEYKAGSAFGDNCDILFSVDGGKTFGHAEDLKINDAGGNSRSALPKEYTHIRWTFKGKLAPGKTGEVGFSATIK